jgi:hypothetical protein
MITTVLIGGQPVDPGMVLADVTVLHGRRQFGEGAAASSATVRGDLPAGPLPEVMSGTTLVLSGPDGPMFTGRIVQRSLEHFTDADGSSWGRFTVTAAGPVAVLGARQVGDAPWPQESATQRAGRVLAQSGVPWNVQAGAAEPDVLPRDVDAQPALGLLEDLAQWTAGAVFDTPDGQVIFQSLASRHRAQAFMWSDADPAWTWDTLDPALTWDGAPPSIGQTPSPSTPPPIVLPAHAVIWEPEWSSSEADVINHVRVAYGTAPDGGDQPSFELRDQASIDAHNRRYLFLGTQLASLADAQAQAAQVLTTRARERWQLGTVTVDLVRLEPDTYAAVLRLVCGDHLILRGLPQPGPAIDWAGIVEGWTYNTQTGKGGQLTEQMVLALSDPLMSLDVMAWEDYPSLYTWDGHDPAWTWDDMDNLAA